MRGLIRKEGVDLSTQVGSVSLPNPVMTASGTIGHGFGEGEEGEGSQAQERSLPASGHGHILHDILRPHRHVEQHGARVGVG